MLKVVRSPLEIACRWGLLEIGRLLLARGASIEHIDSSGCTALTMLWFNMNLSFSRTEYAKALLALSSLPLSLERQESLSPLACVAMRGSAEDVKALLDLGANVHELDASGNRIMKYCIIGSNLRTYDCLIPYMPPGWIYEVDSRGRSHLHLALEFPGSNTKDIAERLLKAGADVHAVDASGILPEHLAKTTDESANRFRVWREGECGNLSAYLQALASCGFDVVMDDEGDFHWSSEPPLS